MARLLENEIKKVFKKKSLLVVIFIFILYAILTNVIYHNFNDYDVTDKVNIKELENINDNLDLSKEEELEEYISNLSEIKLEELKKEFNFPSANYLIENYLKDIIIMQKRNEYGEKDIGLQEDLEREYNTIYTKIKDDNFKYFINIEIDKLKQKQVAINDNKQKKIYDALIRINEYKLNNDIPFDEANYLFRSTESIATDYIEYCNLKSKSGLTKDEKEYLENLEEQIVINKYILEKKVDINNSSNLRAVLMNFSNEFGLFILIFVLMISGSIVSEEYNKGTIKYLLTKPYKRSSILTAKLLTVLFSIPFIIILMIIIEIIIGGFILDFNSLNIPVLVYKASSSTLVEMNIFSYLVKSLISNLPIYIVLGVFAFMLSTITASTSGAITITFLFYLVSSIISELALSYDLKIFKGFISIHWNFSYLVNFSSNPYGFKPIISVIVVLIYLILMIFLSYFVFIKKDVKNI